MKKKLEAVLRILARRILKKYKPKIIAITGSVGKTSTKEAVFCALKNSFTVRESQKNYNNEIGVPLTIIGKTSENSSLVGWIKVLLKAAILIIKKDKEYPEILILEAGTDKPGDMQYLRTIFTPDFVIITSIAEAHLEFFGTVEKIAEEKLTLAKGLSDSTPIFINGDNRYLKEEMKKNKKLHYIPYGFDDKSIIHATKDRLLTDKKNRYRVLGIETMVNVENDSEKLFLPGVISNSHIYSALGAIGVARALGKPLNTIIEDLRLYRLPAGRMKLIPGIKKTLVIDDTYNSSPAATVAAFEAIDRLPLQKKTKRWAVLGDMLELGKDTDKIHQEIGKEVFEYKFDYLITVGVLSKEIAKGAKNSGMDADLIYSFDDHKAAGRFLEDRVNPEDIIFIKGSQGARMEKIVKEVMREPMRAAEFLVRQDITWIGN